jgi:hypothetical protein
VDALSAYLDRELPEADRRAVEAHVAACADCARHLAELAALDGLARDAPAPAAPAGYFEALPGRVRARIRAPRRTIAPAWLLPLAAGIVVAVVAPLVLRENAERATTAPAAAPASPPAFAAPPAAPPAEAKAAREPGGPPPEEKAEREERPPRAGKRAEPAPAANARRDAPRPEPAEREFAAAPEALREQAVVAEAAPAEAAGGVSGGAVGGLPAAPDAAAGASTAQAQTAERDRAAGPLAVGRAKAAPRAAVAPPAAERFEAEDDAAFRSAAAIPLTSTRSARRALEAWRSYLRAHAGAEADEARVRLVEAAVAVHRHSGDETDRAAARREADAYLADPRAPQRDRVRAAIAALDRGREP